MRTGSTARSAGGRTGGWKTMTSPRLGDRKRYASLDTITRSPSSSFGSIDADGM